MTIWLRNPRRAGAAAGRWSRACADIDIHDDLRHIINAAGREFCAFLDGIVADSARKFHDAVMYFDADGARDDIFTIELRDDVLLYLGIVFHQRQCSSRSPQSCQLFW